MDQPGFYPDPTEPGQLRFWNGLMWTDDTQPEPELDVAEPAVEPGGGEAGATPPEHTPEPETNPPATPEPTPHSENPHATRKTITIGVLLLVALLSTVFFLTKDTIAFAGGATRTTASASKDYTSTTPTRENPRGSRCTLRYQYIAEGTVYTGTTGCNYLFSGGRIDIEYANWFPGVSRLADPPSRFTPGLLIELAIRVGIPAALILGLRWVFRLARDRTPANPGGGQTQVDGETPFEPEQFDALIKPPDDPRGDDPPAPGTR